MHGACTVLGSSSTRDAAPDHYIWLERCKNFSDRVLGNWGGKMFDPAQRLYAYAGRVCPRSTQLGLPLGGCDTERCGPTGPFTTSAKRGMGPRGNQKSHIVAEIDGTSR